MYSFTSPISHLILPIVPYNAYIHPDDPTLLIVVHVAAATKKAAQKQDPRRTASL